MLYEITAGSSTLAVIPCDCPSPQLRAVRTLYDLSLHCGEPLTLWRLTFGGAVTAFPICSLCRGQTAPLPLN